MNDYYDERQQAKYARERINQQLEAAAEALAGMPDDANVITVEIFSHQEKPTIMVSIATFNRLFSGREVYCLPGTKANHYDYHGDLATFTAVLAKETTEAKPIRVVLPLHAQPHVAEAACEVSINELGEFVLTDSHGEQHVGPLHELEAALDRRDNLVIEDDGE